MHKILLVDDNSTMRQILKLYMMGKMHTFLEAESAEKAFEVLQREEVDLLIVDIHLGKIDGVSFVKTLRESNAQARNVPVVFISGDRDGGQALKELEGQSTFLLKPLDREKLVQVVDSLLPRKAG
jgi:CheY-like chemotaxis protein